MAWDPTSLIRSTSGLCHLIFVEKAWARSKPPSAEGTSFEGADPEWMKRVVLAGGGVNPTSVVSSAKPTTPRLGLRSLRRLANHLEAENLLAGEQWGFRPRRSAIDALFVISRIMADAAHRGEIDPVILDMMDIQKAYPNCSRNAMDKSLELMGVPGRMRTRFAKLVFWRTASATVGGRDWHSWTARSKEGSSLDVSSSPTLST